MRSARLQAGRPALIASSGTSSQGRNRPYSLFHRVTMWYRAVIRAVEEEGHKTRQENETQVYDL